MNQIKDTDQFSIDRHSAVPVYLQLADFLKQKICSGEFKVGMRFPPEAEFARMIGIHRITLRKSLHILSSQDLITQSPHRGTFVAKKTKRHLRLGIVANPNTSGTYMTSLMLEIEKSILKFPEIEQVFLVLSEKDDQTNLDIIANSNCDALLIPCRQDQVFRILDLPKFDLLPMVFINWYAPQLKGLRYSISLDRNSIRTGVEYLKSLGHKKIVYITAPADGNQPLELRNASFSDCMTEEMCMIQVSGKKNLFKQIKTQIKKLCRKQDTPTAVMTPGIAYTSAVWHGVLESSLKVPEDISILGFDPATDTYPMASTLDQPVREMVQKAVSLLYGLCCGKTFLQHLHLYKAVVHDRGSIKKLDSGTKSQNKKRRFTEK